MNIMTIVHSLEQPPTTFTKSIFLAGPTPRDENVGSWRIEALQLLQDQDFDGVVFVPERADGLWHGDKQAQIEWEDRCLNMADTIMFWVPRHMDTLPGLTTNVEFGRWENSGRIAFGSPVAAIRNDYLLHYAAKYHVPTVQTLNGLIKQTIQNLGDGIQRTAGEREVPLLIWRTPAFTQWYASLKAAGNRLDHAKQMWTFRVGPDKKIVFLWALHVDIYVVSEQRHKVNEVVIARPDISSIVMYQRAAILDESIVVLVREFRSPVSNDEGFVYETPGGSSFEPGGNPLQLAADEVSEETGMALPADRFQTHQVRQMVATVSAHQSHLFSVELTDAEVVQLRSQAGVAYGLAESSEQTYVEVMTLGDIRRGVNVDWSMLGMILQVLA